jgi:hypothetical protein
MVCIWKGCRTITSGAIYRKICAKAGTFKLQICMGNNNVPIWWLLCNDWHSSRKMTCKVTGIASDWKHVITRDLSGPLHKDALRLAVMPILHPCD